MRHVPPQHSVFALHAWPCKRQHTPFAQSAYGNDAHSSASTHGLPSGVAAHCVPLQMPEQHSAAPVQGPPRRTQHLPWPLHCG